MTLVPVAILLLFAFISGCMAVLAFRHLAAGVLRRSFLFLLAGAFIWFVPLVLVRAPGLDAEAVALASRFLFVAGILMAVSLFIFCDSFTASGNRPRFLRPAILGGALVLFILVLLGLVEHGVTGTPGKFSPVRGPAHPFYIIALVGLLLYCFFLLGKAAFNSDDAQLRFQARSILAYGGLGLMTLAVNNGILPIFFADYTYPYIGALGFIVFLAGILRMLWRGQSLYLRNIYEGMFLKPLWQIQENFTSFIRLSELLNSIVTAEAQPAFNQPLTFFRKDKSRVQVHWHDGSETVKDKNKNLSGLGQGLLDNLTRLEFDNKRLALALLKAQQIVEKTGGVLEADARLPELAGDGRRDFAYRIDDAVPEIKQHMADYKSYFGEDLIVFNPAMFSLLEKLQHSRLDGRPAIFIGEAGTGKRTLARAMHYFHFKAGLWTIDCAHHTAAEIRKLGRELTEADGDRKGILLANIDALGSSLSAAVPFFELGDGNPVYMTAADESVINRLPKAIRLVRPYHLFEVPPLRDRLDDLTYQTLYYFEQMARRAGLRPDGVTAEFMDEIRAYNWPGNSSELIMALSRLFTTSGSQTLSGALALPDGSPAISGLTALEVAERNVVERYLKHNDFNKSKTASQLGITINTLKAKINKYNLLAS